NVTAGSVIIDSGGRWSILTPTQSVGSGLENHGTLLVVDTTISGPVNSPAGSAINVVGNVVFNGLVSGAGQFFGSGRATFNGGNQPGDSPATINFEGSATLGNSNVLTIELGGTTPGAQYDQLHVARNLGLAGTLHVVWYNDFHAAVGD